MLKNTLSLFIFFMLLSFRTIGQEVFIIEGDTLKLKREVKGSLNLYYSDENRDFRYFVQKGQRMMELKEEKTDGVPRYKLQLEDLTRDAPMDVMDVKFELYSLKHFTNIYNAKVQEDYDYNASTENVRMRIGLFTGLSNNKYTDNPDNVISPVIGLGFEIYDPNLAPRHSAFLHLRQSFKRDDFRYTSTQLSVNYRFKVIRLPKMDFHINAELANLMFSSSEIEIINDAGEITDIREDSGFSFTAPLSFGIGSDIKITENGYLILGYNDIVSVVLDGNGNFPIDFTIGYKYNL